MTSSNPTPAGPGPARTLAVLFGLPVGALLLGALLAPPVYNGLTAFGRAHAKWSFLRELEFESVVGRCVLVLVVLSLPLAARLAGFRSWRALGWPGRPGGVRAFLRFSALGAASMLALFLLGWAVGGYTVRVEARAWAAESVAMLLAGAVLVGVLEETLFRGLYYQGLRRVLRPWTAAVASSLWFAVLHFSQPFVREGLIVAEWNDGLVMIGDCFYTGHVLDHYVPFILTLFVMGLVLSRAVEHDGTLHRAAGLHAGWVLAMRWGMFVWDRAEVATPGWFGSSDLISKSWVTLILAVAWLAAGEARRPRSGQPGAV